MTTNATAPVVRKTYARRNAGRVAHIWLDEGDKVRLNTVAKAFERHFVVKPSIALVLRAGLRLLEEKMAELSRVV